MQDNILIYDIETSTNGVSVKDIDKHNMVYFGAYSYKTGKYYFLHSSQRREIENLLRTHKILIGFNNRHYDNPILERHGYKLNYKIIMDLYKIIKSRAGIIQYKNTFLSYVLKSYSLDTIIKTLKLAEETKMELDYKLLDKENLTIEEIELIKEYTIRDIELTKKLFEYVYDRFDDWKYHLSPIDQQNLKHLSCAQSVYAYKVLANRCGFKEEYADTERKYQGEGGYVAYPAAEKVEGNVYCLDFASLYPHIMIQCNLYGRNKHIEQGWNGKYNAQGFYNDVDMNEVSKVLMDIYKERRELKAKGDPREYGLKITLNTVYGLLRNPTFVNVCDTIAGRDCCLIGQEWIKLARRMFMDAGYFVFYTDTDSVYLQDPFDDKEQILKIKDELIKEIKNNVPFPQDTFDMDIDYEIDMIHFFKGGLEKDDSELDEEDIKNKELGLMKKNYLFVYKDGDEKKLFIKNLGIVKRSNTELSKKIFWDKMVPEIIETNNCKFENEEIKNWIDEYLDKNIMLISKRMAIQDKKNYKSKGALQVQAYDYIPEGEEEPLRDGIHFFIPNFKLGIGKGHIKYCTIEEFENNLTLEDVYTHAAMRELRYFNSDYEEYKACKTKKVKFEIKLRQMGLWD